MQFEPVYKDQLYKIKCLLLSIVDVMCFILHDTKIMIGCKIAAYFARQKFDCDGVNHNHKIKEVLIDSREPTKT
jgi:hypothetical protein